MVHIMEDINLEIFTMYVEYHIKAIDKKKKCMKVALIHHATATITVKYKKKSLKIKIIYSLHIIIKSMLVKIRKNHVLSMKV